MTIVNVPVPNFEVQLVNPMNRHEWADVEVPEEVLIAAATWVLNKHGDELERVCVALIEGRKPA